MHFLSSTSLHRFLCWQHKRIGSGVEYGQSAFKAWQEPEGVAMSFGKMNTPVEIMKKVIEACKISVTQGVYDGYD